MANIWFDKTFGLPQLQGLGKDTMGDHLDIVFTDVGENYIKATMPVNEKTRQPYGLLHGGASAVLAETLGSVASAYVVDHAKHKCVGLEINANHIRAVRGGLVTGIATPLHLGATTHVWDIKIYNDQQKLVCVSRLTVAIIGNRV